MYIYIDKCPIHLLYADVVVLLFQIQNGLKWTFYTLSRRTTRNQLFKSQGHGVCQIPQDNVWQLNNHLIEQVKTFRYLGFVFHVMGNMPAISAYTCRRELQLHNLSTSLKEPNTYLQWSKSFHPRPELSSSLESSWVLQQFLPFGKVQSKFLKNIFQIPCCISYVMLLHEASLLKIEPSAQIYILSYWLFFFSRAWFL